jgi:acetyltransferase-like isoleucine patch superfamily enzyme
MLRPIHGKGKFTIGKGCSGQDLKDVIIDVSGDITIGNEVIISDQCIIYTHYHPMKKRKSITRQTKEDGVIKTSLVIGDDVFLGARCIILPQVTNIPRGTVIAAGAILTKNPTEEYEIWGGNPAKKIGERQ